MFKVIESDEEFEAALAAGLLWINVDDSVPRGETGWRRARRYEPVWARQMWQCAHTPPHRTDAYIQEDFAVLVEDD